MSTPVYEIISAQIIARFETGVVPWRQPWRTGLPKNLVFGKASRHQPVSVLDGARGTFRYQKKAEELGGRIRCKGCPVVFSKMLEWKNPKSGEIERIQPLRYYKVYPVSGIDGLEVPVVNAAPLASNSDMADVPARSP